MAYAQDTMARRQDTVFHPQYVMVRPQDTMVRPPRHYDSSTEHYSPLTKRNGPYTRHYGPPARYDGLLCQPQLLTSQHPISTTTTTQWSSGHTATAAGRLSYACHVLRFILRQTKRFFSFFLRKHVTFLTASMFSNNFLLLLVVVVEKYSFVSFLDFCIADKWVFPDNQYQNTKFSVRNIIKSLMLQ